jgi:hypothetical protein
VPSEVERRSLTTLQAKVVKIGGKILADARSGTVGDRALARSDVQPAAPALGHRHA